MSTKRGAPAPAVVGSHFVKQYYGEVLSKKPVELHRFYKDESTFCHASGTKEEEPVSGLADIKAKIEHLGLGGATVDLGCGSVDAQPSEGGGVLLMVTGSITIASMDPRQFCQTFFLSRQYQDNDRHNYFVRNDIFRFLDVLPEVIQASLRLRDEEEGSTARSTPVAEPASRVSETGSEAFPPEQERDGVEDTSATVDPVTAIPPAVLVSTSPVGAATVPDTTPSPMAMGAAPPSESQVAASSAGAADAGGDAAATGTGGAAAAVELDNGSGGKAPSGKTVAPAADTSPVVAGALSPETTAAPALPTSPVLPAAPSAPAARMTYASLAKSWATVVGGDASAPSLSPAGGPPAVASVGAAGAVASGNGVVAAPASNGGWGVPEVAGGAGIGAGPAGVGVGVNVSVSVGGGLEQASSQAGSGGGQGSSGPSSASARGPQGTSEYIPVHASPQVAASAAAAREAAAAGNGEILPATSIFVRKVDMTIDREEMIKHFTAYGDVTGISMNPTRGYAFIDYRSNECVQSALSTKDHYVNRKLLVVEERHSPMLQRNSRGEHGGRGGRNGGRGRGSGGRDGRDGERGDRRSTGGRGGRGGGLGRGDRPEAKDGGGYKARGRAEPA